MEAARVYFADLGIDQVIYDVRRRNTAATSLGYASGYRPFQTLYLLPGIDL